jgi:F420-non-reducing hydrogenase iron-sulfur subunit
LRIEWIAASEGARFAEIMNDFVSNVKGLGPLGQREGIDAPMLRTRLAAAQKLVPYVKLVERERLRVDTKSEEAYREFFAREETDRLFGRLMKDMLAMSQIVEVLGERPLSNAEITAGLKLDSSEV